MFISFPISDEDDRKLFVGHLGQEVNEKDIKKYFMKYGKVVDVDLKRNVNGSSRREYITSILLFNLFSSNLVKIPFKMFTGYAFVVFKDVATLNKVLAKSSHIIKGHKAFYAKAEAHGYAKANASAQRGGFRGGLRGRGGFRGAFRGRGGFRGGFGRRGRFGGPVGAPQVVHNYNYTWVRCKFHFEYM